MPIAANAFVQGTLVYLSVAVGVLASLLLFLFLVTGYQTRRVRHALAAHQQLLQRLEGWMQISGGWPGSEPGATEPVRSTKTKVLHLHRLGRSAEEIAKEAGIRQAEVDFLIQVDEHLRMPNQLGPENRLKVGSISATE